MDCKIVNGNTEYGSVQLRFSGEFNFHLTEMNQQVSFKHLDREFRTEHKVFFLLNVVIGGQTIKVIERNCVADYQVTFDFGGADWLCDVLNEAMVFRGNHGFSRSLGGYHMSC